MTSGSVRILFLVLLLIIIVAAACNDHPYRYTSLDPKALTHVNWQVGSYWIMQDSASGELDSFVVRSVTPGVENSSDNMSNETLFISISEIAITKPATDTPAWCMSIGTPENVTDFIFISELNGNNSSWKPLLYNVFSDEGLTQSDVTCDHNYMNVYVHAQAFNDYIKLVMDPIEGLIHLKVSSGSYVHTWCLVRKNVVHKP